MKIVIAPDSFKGSLAAVQACDAIKTGIGRVVSDVEIVSIPMADGGEGTVDALVTSTSGKYFRTQVTGPLGETVAATYGILGQSANLPTKTAVIEMAQAAGLELVPPDKRNPLYTTTYGLGQLIGDAFDNDCRSFIIGIGGSATNDCGTGMAQALGAKFIDRNGKTITAPMTGNLTGQVGSIDTTSFDSRISKCDFLIACDVNNPLLGPNGASYTYGPQKGADEFTVRFLDANMAHIIGLIESTTGNQVREIAGSGAAGGLGAGLLAFLDAKLAPGIDIVMNYSDFKEKIRSADLIITGEGRIDATTVSGKTIAGVAAAAVGQSIPVVVLAGSVGQDIQKVHEIGVKAVFSICSGPISLEKSIQNAHDLLAGVAEQVVRLMMARS